MSCKYCNLFDKCKWNGGDMFHPKECRQSGESKRERVNEENVDVDRWSKTAMAV